MLKVRDGDLGKLSFLFERYHRALFNFFLRSTGNRDLSEDLVQEVFLRILKYRHTFRPDSQFSAWMYHVARNAQIDHFRKHKHADEASHESEEDVSVEAILAILAENAAAARRSLAETVSRVDPGRTCGCREAMRFSIITDRGAIPGAARERLKAIVGRYL